MLQGLLDGKKQPCYQDRHQGGAKVKKRDLMTDLKSIQEGCTLFDDPDPSVETKYELYEVAEHAIERALEAEAEALKSKEAHRHVLDILNVVSDIVVETKDRSENDTSQYADGQYDLCDTISKSIAWKVAAIGAQSLLEKRRVYLKN